MSWANTWFYFFYIRTKAEGASSLMCSGQEHADFFRVWVAMSYRHLCRSSWPEKIPLAEKTLHFSGDESWYSISQSYHQSWRELPWSCAISAGGDCPNLGTFVVTRFPLSTRRWTFWFLLIFSAFICLRDNSAVSLPPNIQQLQIMTSAITIIVSFNEK